MRTIITRTLLLFTILFASTNKSNGQCPPNNCPPNTGSARITKIPTCFNEAYEISVEGEFKTLSINSSVGEALVYSSPIRVNRASTVSITFYSDCYQYYSLDGVNCGYTYTLVERTQTIVIPQDAPTCNLTALVTSITPESKYGCYDGSATITVNTNACNGWDGFIQNSGFVHGSSGEPYTFKNLSAGTYDMVIYSSPYECNITVPITIPGPACELSGEVTSTTPVSGYGARDGTVTIKAITNSCNGLYYASDGRYHQSGESFTLYGLAAGEGTANIATTTGDCNRNVSYTVPGPACSIDARVISVLAPSFGCDNGLVTINATTSDINGWLGPDDQYHPSGGDATFIMPVGQNSIEIRTGSGGCSKIIAVTVPVGIKYYLDSDGDGFGDPTKMLQDCIIPSGYVTNNSDCDDTKASVYPGAVELCDGVDNNCNGQIDEGVKNTYYLDADGDGYGKSSVSLQACTAPAGYVSNSTDCDDALASVHPGAAEICDGLDNNCNGLVDDGIILTTYYKDNDGDGYGNAAISVSACIAPAGYVSVAGDCNDNNAAIKPGAVELCDGVDNNCDGQIDEGVKTTYYQDSDGDGYGKASVSIQACAAPTGYVSNSTDCNDNNAAIKPGAIEICGNNIDDDCDGLTDETCTPTTLPSVQISNASVKEGNAGTTNAVFNLRLSSRSSVPVTIQYQTINGTAIAPADYVNSSGTITFPANTLSQTIAVQVKGDLLNEANEKFSVTISNPVNATISNNTGTGTIQDDDKLPALRIDDASASENSQTVQLKVYLTTASGQVVTVKYDTKNKTAKAPGDYTEINNVLLTFQPGETEKFINIVIKQDNLNEQTEQFEVNLKNANNAQLSANQGGKKDAIVNILNSIATSINTNSNLQAMNTTDQPLALQVKVLPNPSQNYFQLNIASNGKGIIHLRITDLQGRVVEERKSEGMTQQIKLGDNWRNGSYILEVMQGGERKTMQLVKLR